MADNNKSAGSAFARGLLGRNTAFRLGLGLCPALAVTTCAANGLAMGLATACALVCVNLLMSLLRGALSEKGRFPVLLALSATAASIVWAVLRACFPEINAALGLFVPLIAVNTLILSRANGFAAESSVAASLADGLGMGVGYAIALTLLGAVRELLGSGSVFGVQLLGSGYEPVLLALMPAGGLMVYGLALGIVNAISRKRSGDGEGAST